MVDPFEIGRVNRLIGRNAIGRSPGNVSVAESLNDAGGVPVIADAFFVCPPRNG
jgi:hypothetical protein